MTMFRCTTDKYDQLYARWLDNPDIPLIMTGWEPGQTLLDLCGGTGVVTREALRQGADPDDVVLVDLNPRCSAEGVRQIQGNLNDPVGILERVSARGPRTPRDLRGHFDVVICRQAMAYLDLDETWFRWLSTHMRPGGRFMFNMFRWPEETARWAFHRYNYEEGEYFEAALTLFGRVYHLQVRQGAGFDITSFRCYREGHILKMLDKAGFDVAVHRRERSLRWVCTWPGN